MVDNFLYAVHNIWSIGLVRFVVFLALAFVAAKLVSGLVTKLLKLVKLDEKLDKWGINEGAVGTSMKFIGKLVYLIVFLSILPNALEAIGITAIADPISSFVSAFISYLPNIIAAVILVYIGILVASLVCGLLGNVLTAVKFDSVAKKILPQMKTSATKAVVNIVKAVIIIFAVAQGIQTLNLSVLNMIATDILAYLPLVVKAAVILIVASVGANALETLVAKVAPCAANIAKLVKAAVFTVAGFMILSQLGIAPAIVNTAFEIMIAAVAVAFALAFGLGGKDFAKKVLEEAHEKASAAKKDGEAK